jgi:hypothetical protein
MKTAAQLILFGSLRKKTEKLSDDPVLLNLKGPTPLLEVLRRQRIPVDMLQLAMVNHRAVSKDSTINPGDRLALFSKEFVVFADWKDLRF